MKKTTYGKYIHCCGKFVVLFLHHQYTSHGSVPFSNWLWNITGCWLMYIMSNWYLSVIFLLIIHGWLLNMAHYGTCGVWGSKLITGIQNQLPIPCIQADVAAHFQCSHADSVLLENKFVVGRVRECSHIFLKSFCVPPKKGCKSVVDNEKARPEEGGGNKARAIVLWIEILLRIRREEVQKARNW